MGIGDDMKKIICVIVMLCLCACSNTEKVKLKKTVTIEFYSVATCAECKAFKKHAIPYFKERYGGKVKIKMYDMDDDGTKKPYDQVIKSLKDFDENYYGMSPFVNIKGYMAYLGYRTGDEKQIVKDLEAKLKGKKMSAALGGHRYMYK